MAFKARIAVGAASLALTAGGLGMAGLLPAGATTPPCGSANCSSIYSLKFRQDFPLDVYDAKSSYGQPVILFQRSNSDPAQDFVVKDLGTVDSFYTSSRGLISPAFDQAYGPEEAFEIQYEPHGKNSNFCVGSTPDQIAQSGEKVALYPCGASASTIWAQDTNPNDGTTAPGYSVYINGETNSFSNPLVLNYPAGNPTEMPRVQLNVQPLSDYSSAKPYSGSVYDNQQWNGIASVLPPPPPPPTLPPTLPPTPPT